MHSSIGQTKIVHSYYALFRQYLNYSDALRVIQLAPEAATISATATATATAFSRFCFIHPNFSTQPFSAIQL
jgi:hypothetical protein